MKIAVVGATGFVGGHILRVLRAGGGDVRAVVRNPRRFVPDEVDRRVADAGDVQAMRDALAGCDCVVHSVVGSPEVILGTLAPVYAAAEAVGVRRFVYISTGSVHGQPPAPGTSEASRLTVQQPLPYNTAKVRAERKLRQLRARGTVELVMLRPSIVIGPGSRWVFDFADALNDHRAYVVDGAQGICNSIYVDNLAHAVGLALTARGVDGEAFLVGDSETVTWADLYRAIAEGLGFNFDEVPSLSPPEISLGFRNRYVEPLRSSEFGRVVLPRVPQAIKGIARRAYRAVHSRPSGSESRAAESRPSLTATDEITLLHRCRWRFPQEKARRVLGYVPPVSFDEGCRRSVAWLRERAH